MTKNELNNRRLNSLEALENEKWADSIQYQSTLIKKCHELRKIPIYQLTVEDLRILIGQNIGLKFLIPLAIDILTENILAEGDYFPGDLLQNVLNVDQTFWNKNEEYKKRIIGLINRNSDIIEAQGIKLYNFDTQHDIN